MPTGRVQGLPPSAWTTPAAGIYSGPASPGVGYDAGAFEPPSSSGLGLRPFKAATGIRIPLGARRGGVVKSGVHAGLSSRRSRVQIPSLPPPVVRAAARARGQVAQLEERRSEKPEVGGSIPPLTTAEPTGPTVGGVRHPSNPRLEATLRRLGDAPGLPAVRRSMLGGSSPPRRLAAPAEEAEPRPQAAHRSPPARAGSASRSPSPTAATSAGIRPVAPNRR